MGKGNIDNLIKNEDLTPEQRRESARNAGIASGKARKDRKQLREALNKLLKGQYDIPVGEDNTKKVGGFDAIATSMILQAINGNVKAATFIRDTIGEKPTDTVSFENEDLTGIKIKFVNKSKPSNQPEKDPKIVGDYTPPQKDE